MLTVEDFKIQQNLKPEDFSLQGTREKFLPAHSVATVAATSALLEQDVSVNRFRELRDQLQNTHGRVQFSTDQKTVGESLVQGALADFGNIMTDTSLDVEAKQRFLESTQSGVDADWTPSTLQTLAENAIVADSGKNETEQSAESRNLMLDSVTKLVQSKREMASMINALRLEHDAQGNSKAADFGELFLPFQEWIYYSRMAESMPEDQQAIFLGNQKAKLFEILDQVPVSERAKLFEGLLNTIAKDDNGKLVFGDGNDIILFDTLEHMAGLSDYSDKNRFADTAFGVMDFLGVGAALKAVTGASKNLAKARKITTINETIPTAPSQILKDTNPEAARDMHKLVLDDPTDEAAEALYGTTRSQALSNDILPTIPDDMGKVPNKVTIGPQFSEPEYLRSARTESGYSQYSLGELDSAKGDVTLKLSNVEGMVPHKESLVIKTMDDGTTSFGMMYRPTDNGFASAEQALESAEYAFRNFGLTKENFTLYARVGDQWEPTTLADITGKKALRDEFARRKKAIPEELKTIDYAVGMEYNLKVTPNDVANYDFLDVKRNWLDYLPNSPWAKGKQGSLTQHLFPADSSLHTQITIPMSQAYDKSIYVRKLFVDTFDGFTKRYNAAKADRRAKLSDYIHEANFKGIRFSENDLRARGFNNEEITTLREWRKSNDALWYSTNQDMALSLKNKGYSFFVDANNTNLVVRDLPRGSLTGVEDVLDSVTGTVKQMSKADLDALYQGKQSVAKLSHPVKIGNDFVEHVVVPNTPNGGYLRSIDHTRDKVMSYRDGYYPVDYDASFFIYEAVKLRNGQMTQKVVASARTIQEARKFTQNLQNTHPNKSFDFRADVKNTKGEPLNDSTWSLITSSNLSSQKYRGERLVDAGSNLHLAGKSNLTDPLEAVSNQIYKLSERIAVRPYLDAVKQRWLANYGDKLNIPKLYGKPVFPATLEDIVKTTKTPAKMLADARTTFNYVRQLEEGFVNTIDDGFKALMNYGSDALGEMGFGKLETFLRGAGNLTPTGELKGLTFKLFLAANPPRQLVIQAHQAIQLTALTPQYMLTGGLSRDLFRLNMSARGLSNDVEATEMMDELRKSGFLEAVDANNLIRQDKLSLAEGSNLKRLGKGLGVPLKVAQTLGFDQGERFVLVTSWLAHRQQAIDALKAGQKLGRRDYELIAGKARAYTYSMNKAGDMPYNRNSLNVVAQFLQVPHKAFLQPFTSRNLSRSQRARLLAFNTIMYGVPAGIVANLVRDKLGDGIEKDVIVNGLEDTLLNHVLTMASGEDQQIDFGDLAPTDVLGTAQFLASIATLDIGKMVAEAPVTSLFFGNNPRITNMFSTAARYFHLVDDYEDPKLDTKFTDVALAAANLFSGFSNTFKAKYAYETGTKVNSAGNIADSDVSKVEAAFAFFGFRTKTESGLSEAKEIVYGKQSYEPTDVDSWYNSLKQHLARRGQSVREAGMEQRVLAEAWRVFGLEEQSARKRLLNLIQRDLKNNEYSFLDDLRSKIGVMDNKEVMNAINILPDGPLKDGLKFDLNRLIELQNEMKAEREGK